jgi:CheY-like chemotaxis protein
MPRRIRILIVEDNEDERLFIKDGSTQTGLYEIVGEASNGDEMIEVLNASIVDLPDLILSDLNMPGRNGYEVIVDVKTNSAFSHIPVIILTTAPLKPYAERCKKLGACAYYTKPDTFLEYKEFAEEIYLDIRGCFGDSTIDYTSVEEQSDCFIRYVCTAVANFLRVLVEEIVPKDIVAKPRYIRSLA